MKAINSNGELLVANRPTANPDVVVFDPASNGFVKPVVKTVGGVATWVFEAADPPQRYFDPVTSAWYAPVLTTVGGVVTWQFIAA